MAWGTCNSTCGGPLSRGFCQAHKALGRAILEALLPKVDHQLCIFEADCWVEGFALQWPWDLEGLPQILPILGEGDGAIVPIQQAAYNVILAVWRAVGVKLPVVGLLACMRWQRVMYKVSHCKHAVHGIQLCHVPCDCLQYTAIHAAELATAGICALL